MKKNFALVAIFAFFVLLVSYYIFNIYSDKEVSPLSNVNNQIVYTSSSTKDFLSTLYNSDEEKVDADRIDFSTNASYYSSKITDYLVSNQQKLNPFEIGMLKIYVGSYLVFTTDVMGNNPKNAELTTRSYNIFDEVYNSAEGLSEDQVKVLRTKSLLYSYQTLINTCYLDSWFISSKWSNNPKYISLKEKYKDSEISTFMFFEQEFAGLGYSDKTVLAYKIFNESILLDSFSASLSSEENKSLANNLRTNLSLIDSAPKTKLLTGDFFASIFPAISKVYALSILKKIDPDMAKVDIDTPAKEAMSLIDNNINTGDVWGYNLKLWFSSLLSGILFENNGYKLSPEIESINKNISAYYATKSNLVTSMNLFYLQNIKSDMGSWNAISKRLYKMAQNDYNLKKFLQSVGVSI
jgi:hypothetical protein